MGYFITKGISIEAIATVLPDYYYGREENLKMFDADTVERFGKTTGIYSTYKVAEHQTASDLGYVAAKRIIEKFDISVEDIGVLVFSSPAADYIQPPTSCVLQYRLGLSNECATLDTSHGCSAFPYGSQMVMSMMASSNCKYGLLIVGDTNSKNVSKEDNSYMLSSDSSSAVLFGQNPKTSNEILLKTDGSRFKDIIIPGRGMRELNADYEKVLCQDGVYRNKNNWYMNGMNVFTFATRDVPIAIKEYLEHVNKTFDDFDSIVFHQANGIIVGRLIKILKLDPERVPNVLHDYGNTGGNSLLLALCDKYGAENQSKNLKILSVAFGVGLSLGIFDFEINTDNILPITKTKEMFEEGIINLETI